MSTIPPVVKNNSHHGISTIKSDYPKLFDALLANGAVQLPSKRANSDFNHDPEAVKKAAKLDALYLRTLLAELTKPSV